MLSKYIFIASVTLSFSLSATTAALSQRSSVACVNYATTYAKQASAQGQMLGGAAGGSLIGLGIGALAGASGVGAVIGGTVGLIGGGLKRQDKEQQLYDAAYRDCMAGVR